MSAVNAGQTMKALWKKWWIHHPEIVASHVLSTIGMVGCVVLYACYKDNKLLTQTFDKPLFFRPDDPKAKKTITYYEEGWDRK